MRCFLGVHSWRPCGCNPIGPYFEREFGIPAGPGCPYRRCRRCAKIELTPDASATQSATRTARERA